MGAITAIFILGNGHLGNKTVFFKCCFREGDMEHLWKNIRTIRRGWETNGESNPH